MSQNSSVGYYGGNPESIALRNFGKNSYDGLLDKIVPENMRFVSAMNVAFKGISGGGMHVFPEDQISRIQGWKASELQSSYEGKAKNFWIDERGNEELEKSKLRQGRNFEEFFGLAVAHALRKKLREAYQNDTAFENDRIIVRTTSLYDDLCGGVIHADGKVEQGGSDIIIERLRDGKVIGVHAVDITTAGSNSGFTRKSVLSDRQSKKFGKTSVRLREYAHFREFDWKTPIPNGTLSINNDTLNAIAKIGIDSVAKTGLLPANFADLVGFRPAVEWHGLQDVVKMIMESFRTQEAVSIIMPRYRKRVSSILN